MDTTDKKPLGFRLGLLLNFMLLAVNDSAIVFEHWKERWRIFGLYVPVAELAFLLTFAFGLLSAGKLKPSFAKYKALAMGILVGTIVSLGLYIIQALFLFFLAMYGALGDNCSFSGTCHK